MARTKIYTQNNTTTRRTQRRNRHLKTIYLCFSDFYFLFYFYSYILKWFLQDMLSHCLGASHFFIIVWRRKKCNLLSPIPMLHIEHFKLKHRAKVSCQTWSALKRHANTLLYSSTCTGTGVPYYSCVCIWNCPNIRLRCSPQSCQIECCSCIVDVHVYDV